MAYSALIRIVDVQGGPQKCPYFSLAITKETFKIFSPQILEVCRILLVQTTLESPMFYYTFSVVNDMFDPATALLYDSSISKVKIAHNWAFLVESVWFLFWCCLWEPLLSLDCFHKLCLSGVPIENSQVVEIWRIGWPEVIVLRQNKFVPWEVLLGVLKSSVWAMRWRPILLEHHSVQINAFLSSQCTNKLSSHHLDVLLYVDSHTIPIIVFKKVWPKDPLFAYSTP